MREGLPGPQSRQDVQALVEEFGPDAAIGRLAEQPELGVGGIAEAHAEDDPPATEQSSVVTSLASFHRRRATGVIIVPSLIRDVRAATTARTCHGSTMGGPSPLSEWTR